MVNKRKIIKCEVCNQNRLNCKRKPYGYQGRFYMVCKECQKEMKLTGYIIRMMARNIVNQKPDKFELFIENGRIFGVTPLVSISQ